MRILVVEDLDSVRHMLDTLVRPYGYEVASESSGAKAIERALAERFDILVVDLMLPGAPDALAVIARLRSGAAAPDLPIFVVSALDDPGTRDRAKKAGATAFFGKPMRPLELLEAINTVARAARD